MNVSLKVNCLLRAFTPLLLSAILTITTSFQASAQREADLWYFGYHAGIDFSTGDPVPVHETAIHHVGAGVGTICDSNSNLLFYNGIWNAWNKEHEIMENGADFDQPGGGNESNVIVQQPDSDSIYYIFKVWQDQAYPSGTGLYYSVVDMSLNGGLGKVISRDIPLTYAWDADILLQVTRHRNNHDIWVITRKWRENQYAAFLITSDGINEVPVLSPTHNFTINSHASTYLKVSTDGKFMFLSLHGMINFVEISEFNDQTGEINFMRYHEIDNMPYGIEFSPDGKFVYIAYADNTTAGFHVYQYEMQYVYDLVAFRDSGVDVGMGPAFGLQLATDGRIYSIANYDFIKRVGQISNPWIKGSGCSYNPYALNMAPDTVTSAMPVLMQGYLHRYEFEGSCMGEPYQFTSNFNPVPDSLYWTFNDPFSPSGNNSSALNPIHIFSNAGTYEVEVDVWYPTGRFEHTSRMIDVLPAPDPDLGPDISLCESGSLVLDASCGTYQYLWSNGITDTSRITITDTGTYWVEVYSDVGCMGYDTIHISQFPAMAIDTSSLIISPTTCGGSMGAIRGIVPLGIAPFETYWIDDMGDTISNTPDIMHLAVGNYTLLLTDGNGCQHSFGPFPVTDAGEVLIESVTTSNEHCGQQDAFIHVEAVSGLGDMLFYSIDNGTTWVSNLGDFIPVSPGTYAIRVQDSTLCQDVYDFNPVQIIADPGPVIDDITILPATSGNNDGQIQVVASSSGDTLYYSLNGGTTIQVNNGLFTDLSAGTYHCLIMDEFGCDTIIELEVPESISIILEVVAGEDEACPGGLAYIPLKVSNFIDVARFKATITYNKDIIGVNGISNINPLLADSLVGIDLPAEQKIILTWHSDPLTLSDDSKLMDLVFDARDAGSLGLVIWDATTGANEFTSSTGALIPVDYGMGAVKIYEEVRASVFGEKNLCQGETLNLEALIWSNNGPISYHWIGPDNISATTADLIIQDMIPDQSGDFQLTVTDSVGCTDINSFQVQVEPTPSPSFALQDTLTTMVPVELDAGAGFVHYSWNTGDTTRTVWADSTGWYATMVESSMGCVGSDSSYILFLTEPEPVSVYFPNAFTPNGDGVNDLFNIIAPSYQLEPFIMTIYNRWGQLVFQTNDINRGWDGNCNGKACEAGTYVFKISFGVSGMIGNQYSKTGHITLIR